MADKDVAAEPERDGRTTDRMAIEDLERGVHVAFEDQIQSVPVDTSPSWPDWMEAHRQSQLAGGGGS